MALSSFNDLWFRNGPVWSKSIVGPDESLRFAVDNGVGWAIVQTHLHSRQIEQPHEFVLFPGALLNSMTYSLSQAGVNIPNDLRSVTLDRTGPLEEVFAPGEIALVTIDESHMLAVVWRYQTYRMVVTVYRDDWLGALLPLHAETHLILAEA